MFTQYVARHHHLFRGLTMNERPQTIPEMWNDFARRTLPENVSNVQRTGMQRAFMAGVASMFSAISEVCQEDDDEEVAVAQLDAWNQQIQQFFIDALMGRFQ